MQRSEGRKHVGIRHIRISETYTYAAALTRCPGVRIDCSPNHPVGRGDNRIRTPRLEPWFRVRLDSSGACDFGNTRVNRDPQMEGAALRIDSVEWRRERPSRISLVSETREKLNTRTGSRRRQFGVLARSADTFQQRRLERRSDCRSRFLWTLRSPPDFLSWIR